MSELTGHRHEDIYFGAFCGGMTGSAWFGVLGAVVGALLGALIGFWRMRSSGVHKPR